MASISQKSDSTITPQAPQTNRRRSRKRDRQAAEKRSNGNGSPSTSGASTPRTKDREDRSTNKGKNAVSSANASTNATSTFAEGDDFIPFTFSDPSDNEAGPSTSKRDIKGKGKEVDFPADVEEADKLATTNMRRGETRVEHSDKSVRVQDKSKTREPPTGPRKFEREWDKGKDRDDAERYDDRRNRNGKRIYNDYDDGYANKKERTDAASRKCPWIAGLELERSSNVAEMLHKEVEAFLNWISPSPVEDEIRGLVVTQISTAIRSVFTDATIYPFGSYSTKLYLPLGDIDLVVLSDMLEYIDRAPALYQFANILKRNGITSNVTVISKAKVPIIKFVTTHGRFKVDISINQSNGLTSGNIILGFLKDLIPRPDGRESKALRSLVMITKAFLSQRSMNEVYTGGLGSYSIVCLAVSFLQMHPKIRRGEIDPDHNLGVLVMEFFELYGLHFNYDEVGISLREGGSYFNKRQRGWQSEYKRNMISIEDPADPSNDISSGSYNFHKVRTAFAGCHGILTSTAYLRAGILSARRDGRSVSLRGRYQPEDLSILSTVMGITQETINHRRLVQEVYDKRILHNTLDIAPLPIYVYDTDNHDSRRSGRDADGQKEAESSRSKASLAVQENVDDFDDYHRRRHVDDDSGRYDIGRQPPKKRQRTRAERDGHTVYVVDDDEEDVSLSVSDDGDSVEEIEKPDDFPGRPSRSETSAMRDSRRSYWLSKGIGIEGGAPEDSAR